MSLFKRKQSSVLGIDISSTSVKLLELSRAGAGFKVEYHAVEPLPHNAITEKAISDVAAVGETIRHAIKRAGTKNKHCAMAVSGSAVITKVITMPAGLTDEDMETQIQLEADQYIPFALEEVNLDFEVLGPTEGNADSVDVLLAASRKENIELRVAAAEAAGLTPKVMDIEAYAVENAFSLLLDQVPNEGRDKTVALVDIGATMTCLSVMSNRKLIYTREQPFGGRQLTEEIMQRYGLTYEQAGMAKKQGGLPDDYASEVLEPFKQTLAQQVSRFLQFFYSASQHTMVDYIVLAGGCASIPMIDETVERLLSITTVIANPFNRMSLASRLSPKNLAKDAPSLMVACGLALRSFA
ncbi:MAG: pilus assembly protein PilM [Gammaproteobacteria bacterium]